MSKGHWAIIASIGGTRNYEEYRLLWDTEHAFARLERGEIAQPKVTWVGINDGPWFPEVLWEPISAEMFNT